jgi:hypothetical protein
MLIVLELQWGAISLVTVSGVPHGFLLQGLEMESSSVMQL